MLTLLLPLLQGALSSHRSLICAPPANKCARGAGTLQRYSPNAAPSQSTAACCAACAAQSGCNGWQLVAGAETEDGGGASCWLLPKYALKPSPDPMQNCTGAAMLPPPNPGRINQSGIAGVWVQNGHIEDLVNQSWVRGGDIAVEWSSIEVGPNVWDFSSVDMQFAFAVAAGFRIETALIVGPASPAWIYKPVAEGGGGVPVTMVVSKPGGWGCGTNNSMTCPFPSYLDQRYQRLFLRAVEKFAGHIAELPTDISSNIVAAQAMYGSTGDDCPWHGTPVNPKQDIPTSDPSNPNCTSCDPWHNFTMSTAPIICKSYTSRGIRVLWNTEPSRLDILVAECPGSYIKAGMVSHGFSVNYEADNYETKGKICHTPGYHCRGESWPFCQHGYYTEAPLWATYSHLLWQLTFGVDLPGLSEVNLVNTSYSDLYANVFNRYAGAIRPPATGWVGGIIALRDGLDSANTTRFPESKFGTATVKNKDRLVAIAKAFADKGAREGDLHAATSGAMASRKRNSTNDVGWRIWQGNYGNGVVTQLAPFETSIGRWAVGPMDQPYGRFARSFESATGRTDISFVLDRRLWGGLPLKAAKATAGSARVIRLAIIYLDGMGSFDVFFDSATGCDNARKRSIAGTGTGQWWTTAFDIVDGVFGRGCSSKGGAADIVLRSSSAIDTVFHGLEIYDPTMV